MERQDSLLLTTDTNKAVEMFLFRESVKPAYQSLLAGSGFQSASNESIITSRSGYSSKDLRKSKLTALHPVGEDNRN